MNKIKFVSLLSGITLFAASLMSASVSAASGSLSLSPAAAQTNGSFAVTIFENSDVGINYAEVYLKFSNTVQNVTFVTGNDFVKQSCGTNCIAGYVPGGGTVTGSNILATMYFTLTNPGNVTVSFGDASYLAYPNPEPNKPALSIPVNGISKTYSYTSPASNSGTTNPTNPGTTAPAPKTTTPNNGGNPAAANNTNAPVTAADTAQNSTTAAPASEEVKGENTEKSTDKKSEKKDDAEKTSGNTFGHIVLLALIGAAAFFAGRTLARYMARRNKPSAAAKKTDAAIAAGAAKTKKSTKTNK